MATTTVETKSIEIEKQKSPEKITVLVQSASCVEEGQGESREGEGENRSQCDVIVGSESRSDCKDPINKEHNSNSGEAEVTSTCNSNHNNSEKVKVEPHVVVMVTANSNKGINMESDKDKKDVLDLTKKIFSSFPFKTESLKSENSNSVEIDQNDETAVTEVKMYISENKTLYHARALKGNSHNLDKTSVCAQGGIFYYIEPVKDSQLCDLVIEYLKLMNEQPKGVFSINISGSLVKPDQPEHVDIKADPENEKEADSTSKEAAEKEKNSVQEQNEVPSTNEQEEDVTVKQEPKETENDTETRRRQPLRGVKLGMSTKSQIVTNIVQGKVKHTVIKNKAALQDLYTRAPVYTPPAKKSDSQEYLTSVLEKSVARGRKRKSRLIVDAKTEIPIMEMKMNMQVTADTLCQTSQLAPSSKKSMKLSVKDNVMVSPGKNIQSEKLLKIYSSCLKSKSVPDSDDDLEDLELQPVPEGVRYSTDVKTEPIERNSQEEDKNWKIHYI